MPENEMKPCPEITDEIAELAGAEIRRIMNNGVMALRYPDIARAALTAALSAWNARAPALSAWNARAPAQSVGCGESDTKRLASVSGFMKSYVTAAHDNPLKPVLEKAIDAIFDYQAALDAARAVLTDTAREGWQPIETAPKDRSILAWCDHEADDFVADEKKGSLTLYAAHYEGLSHAPTGWHIVEYGGGKSFDEDEGGGYLPDWWFVSGSEFEVAANPIFWVDLPAAPSNVGTGEGA